MQLLMRFGVIGGGFPGAVLSPVTSLAAFPRFLARGLGLGLPLRPWRVLTVRSGVAREPCGIDAADDGYLGVHVCEGALARSPTAEVIQFGIDGSPGRLVVLDGAGEAPTVSLGRGMVTEMRLSPWSTGTVPPE